MTDDPLPELTDPPRDVMGAELAAGDRIAFAVGAGSSGVHMKVGLIEEVYDGHDRWKRECKMLKVRVEATSEPRGVSHAPGRVARIWMVGKTVKLA